MAVRLESEGPDDSRDEVGGKFGGRQQRRPGGVELRTKSAPESELRREQGKNIEQMQRWLDMLRCDESRARYNAMKGAPLLVLFSMSLFVAMGIVFYVGVIRSEQTVARMTNLPRIDIIGFQEGAVHRIVVSSSKEVKWQPLLCPSGIEPTNAKKAGGCRYTLPRNVVVGQCLSRNGQFICGMTGDRFSVFDLRHKVAQSEILSVTIGSIRRITPWTGESQFCLDLIDDKGYKIVSIENNRILEGKVHESETPLAVSSIGSATLYQKDYFSYRLDRKGKDPLYLKDVFEASMSPLGHFVAYITKDTYGFIAKSHRVEVLNCATGTSTTVTSVSHYGDSLVWTPDDRYLFFHTTKPDYTSQLDLIQNPQIGAYDTETGRFGIIGTYEYPLSVNFLGCRYVDDSES